MSDEHPWDFVSHAYDHEFEFDGLQLTARVTVSVRPSAVLEGEPADEIHIRVSAIWMDAAGVVDHSAGMPATGVDVESYVADLVIGRRLAKRAVADLVRHLRWHVGTYTRLARDVARRRSN